MKFKLALVVVLLALISCNSNCDSPDQVVNVTVIIEEPDTTIVDDDDDEKKSKKKKKKGRR